MSIGASYPSALSISPRPATARTQPAYSSSMCSSESAGDLAARLGRAIDELAILANQSQQAGDRDLADRLAAAWALIAAEDPELAKRTARYSC